MSVDEMKKRGLTYDPVAFNLYNFDHDEWDHSRYMLRQHLATKSAMRYRQPVSFGPSPGPRQPLNQMAGAVSTSRQHHVTYTIRFKTSKTYLRTLLPNKRFSIATPGSFAQASIVCTTLHNLAWLGGKSGYSFCALFLHGVRYTKTDESGHVDGAFMPVIFEDESDPIITGREELGAPKLGCSIDFSNATGSSSQKITLGWRGTTFGTIDLNDLKPATASSTETESEKPTSGGNPFAPPPLVEQGILTWRYVPAVGEPGKVDAEYAVLDPYDDGKHQEEALAVDSFMEQRKAELGFDQGPLHTKSASVKFEAKGWEQLPTLNHVVAGLSDIPVYEILDAKAEFVPSVRDISGARRVD